MGRYEKQAILERFQARRKAREGEIFHLFIFNPWFIINFVAVWVMVIIIWLFAVLMPGA